MIIRRRLRDLEQESWRLRSVHRPPATLTQNSTRIFILADIKEIIAHLRKFDTPTISNALVALRGRTLDDYTRRPVIPAPVKFLPMVGFAMTAKLISDAPSTASKDEQLALRHAYYRYVEESRRPGIMVIEDCGRTPGLGSFWGEVNTAIHLGLQVGGVITSGAIRDLDALSPDLPILAGNVCLSNGYAHLTKIDVPVEVFGMTVKPGDLLHGDQHGAIRIPLEYLEALPSAIDALMEREQFVIEATRKPGFNAEAMIRAWAAMEH